MCAQKSINQSNNIINIYRLFGDVTANRRLGPIMPEQCRPAFPGKFVVLCHCFVDLMLPVFDAYRFSCKYTS